MFGLFPNALYTLHQGQTGGRGLSPRLWGNMYGQQLAPDGFANAFMVNDDFLNFGAVAPAISGTTAGVSGGYGYYVDTATSACSFTQLATASGGVLRCSIGATNDHEAWITSGGNTGVLGAISDTAGADKLTIFEARVRFGQITAHNCFVGLAEEGLAAANTVTDAGALADKDLLGFAVLEGAPEALKFVYRKASGAVVEVATVQTIVADTWYKVGFVYDPAQPTSKRIKVFVNNIENATKVTAANIAAATFPDGEELAFLAGVKTGGAAAKTMDLDWWCFAQAG